MTAYPLAEMDSSEKIIQAFDIKNKNKRNRTVLSLIEDFYLQRLKRDVFNVLFDVSLSQKTHSVFAAGSRLENLYLSEIDHSCPDINQLGYALDSTTHYL